MNLTTKLRPLTIGASIGHVFGPTGTLGAFVKTQDGVGILSASSILAPTPQAKKGDWIHQPGSQDIKALTPNSRIATLYDWVEPSQDSSNVVDAGVALLMNEIEYLGNPIPSGFSCPVEGSILKETTDPLPGMRVGKIGRTTGYTEGMITSVEFVGLGIKYSSAKLFFERVFDISTEKMPFSRPGDAGAIVFTLDPFKAVGLLFAGSDGTQFRTYACPIQLVLERLNVSLLES